MNFGLWLFVMPLFCLSVRRILGESRNVGVPCPAYRGKGPPQIRFFPDVVVPLPCKSARRTTTISLFPECSRPLAQHLAKKHDHNSGFPHLWSSLGSADRQKGRPQFKFFSDVAVPRACRPIFCNNSAGTTTSTTSEAARQPPKGTKRNISIH